MVRELEIINQCVIVSGESVAGKVLYGERAGDHKPVYHCQWGEWSRQGTVW